jgi:hypothetical protein
MSLHKRERKLRLVCILLLLQRHIVSRYWHLKRIRDPVMVPEDSDVRCKAKPDGDHLYDRRNIAVDW